MWLEDRIYAVKVGNRPRRMADVVRVMRAEGVPVTHHDLQRWVGGSVPPVGVLRALARAIGVTVDELAEPYELAWLERKATAGPPADELPADDEQTARVKRLMLHNREAKKQAKRPKAKRRGTG
jgi:hypothetical protein